MCIRDSAKAKKRKSKKAADDSSSSSSSSEEEEEAKDRRVFAAPDLVNDVEGVDLAGSLLHCGRWRRVVLDEAHRIKGFTSSTAKAAFALRAERRWGLTGTPLQNRVKELQSLVRFLKVDPYAYYFCSRKGCDCKTLHWAFGARGARCEHCDHPPMAHYNCFNRKILKPIEQAGYAGAGARAADAAGRYLERGHAAPDEGRARGGCLLYTSPSPRDATLSRMPSSA